MSNNACQSSPTATMPGLLCPNCGGTTEAGDHFCGHCGREIKPVAMTQVSRVDTAALARDEKPTERSRSPETMNLAAALIEWFARLAMLGVLAEVVRQPIEHSILSEVPVTGYVIFMPLAALGTLLILVGFVTRLGAVLVMAYLSVSSYLYWLSSQRLVLDWASFRYDIPVYNDKLDPALFLPALNLHIVATIGLFIALLFIIIHGAGRISFDQLLRSHRQRSRARSQMIHNQ